MAARKYLPSTTPRPPLMSLFILCLVTKFLLPIPSVQNSINFDIESTIANAVKDIVSRNRTLSLCANTNTPGCYRGTTKRTLMSLNIPRTPVSLFIVLSLCGDIETNPGLTAHKDNFPCGFCELMVDWSDAGVCCDQCDIWHHKDCISMTSSEYEGIADLSWKCFKCKTINCSSFVYNGYNLNVTNSFQALARIPGDDSVFSKSIGSVSSPFAPAVHISPVSGPFPIGSDTASRTSNLHTHSSHHSASDNPVHKQANFRTLVVNCNSVRGKPAELAHLLNYTDADVVLLCEAKLDQSVNTAEFLPKHYCSVARKDRNTSGGGVMIALKTKFVAE